MPLPNPNITPGAPPLRWDRVLEAFTEVNENFDSIAATISGGGGGLSPINFDTLDTNVSPAADNTYKLGALGTNRWKSVFLAEYQDTPADAANGVYIGSAHIKGIGSHIDLPINSTIDGELIQQPYFNAIQVDNELRLEATATSTPFGETVNLNSGTKIQLVVNSAGDSITFNNTGVTELAGTAGQIGISGTTGNITLTNLGVLSLTNVTALPAGRTEGAGINVNASTGSGIKVTNTGVLSIVAGSAALIVNTDVATGVVTITNSAPAGNTFGSIIVAGDTSFPIVANSPGANFKVNSGEGITLTKDTTTDTLTITVNPVFDLRGSVFADDSSIMVDAISRQFTGSLIGDVKGSVFGDDSTKIVDAVENKVYGGIFATTLRTEETRIALGAGAGSSTVGTTIAIGNLAGATNQSATGLGIGFRAAFIDQGSGAVAIGVDAGNTTQGANSVALGNQAGETGQGANAVAIGYKAGETSQTAGSIVLNASGVALNGATAGLYVDPIRSTTSSARPVVYNTTTKELFYTSTLEFINSTISTTDSSSITVDVLTTFNSDVVVENDLTVAERLTVKGSRVINLTELQTIVAASADFADFQTRIAALA
jgi:hypothetical protein